MSQHHIIKPQVECKTEATYGLVKHHAGYVQSQRQVLSANTPCTPAPWTDLNVEEANNREPPHNKTPRTPAHARVYPCPELPSLCSITCIRCVSNALLWPDGAQISGIRNAINPISHAMVNLAEMAFMYWCVHGHSGLYAWG